MVGCEAARNARKLLAFQIAKKFAHVARGQDAAKLLMAFGDALADGQQMLWVGHIDATPDDNTLVRNGEIETALVMGSAAPAKRGRNLLLVWLLVLAETCISINAKDGFARIGFVIRSKVVQCIVQRIH